MFKCVAARWRSQKVRYFSILDLELFLYHCIHFHLYSIPILYSKYIRYSMYIFCVPYIYISCIPYISLVFHPYSSYFAYLQHLVCVFPSHGRNFSFFPYLLPTSGSSRSINSFILLTTLFNLHSLIKNLLFIL